VRKIMSEGQSELKTMEIICNAFESLGPSARQRAVQWLLGALGAQDDLPITSAMLPEQQNLNGDGQQEVRETVGNQTTIIATDLSPKEFMSQKHPQSTVERISCLAFYLTHYRAKPMFTGAEIEALNREAAGPTINRYRDMDGARRAGYLAAAENRTTQITTKGEELVNALPNREAAKAVLARYPGQRKRRSANGSKKRGADGDTE
jgi:hypothetical protein